jgi:tetratricopeptide (TPR) repeat protein
VAIPAGFHRVEALTAAGAEPKTADEFARRGAARLSQRAFADAIDDLTKAIELSPKSAAYFRDRSRAYGASGQSDLARADLAKAIELDPHDPGLLRARAVLRLQEKDNAGALADVEAAARLTPPTSLEAADVAALFEQLHQPARAIALFDGVIAVHTADSQLGALLNGRCWVRALANVELDKALDDCNRAIKRDGAKAAYLDSRGLVHFRRGNLAAALADYDAALKLSPQLPWSLYVRGLAKIAQGQTEAGKADQAAASAVLADIAETAAAFGIGH